MFVIVDARGRFYARTRLGNEFVGWYSRWLRDARIFHDIGNAQARQILEAAASNRCQIMAVIS